MNLPAPVTKSSRFARYATASAAALGAAAAADAQFIGDYSLTTGTGNIGAWNHTGPGGAINIGGAPNSIIFYSWGTSSWHSFYLAAPVAVDTEVSFDWAANFNTGFSGDTISAVFNDGTGGQLLQSGATSGSGHATFLIAAGNSFGFQLNANYVHGGASLVISNFSAVAAIPEAGTTGLLAGAAALGFVAVVGARAKRRRAAAQLAE